MILSDAQLRELTGKKHRDAQRRVLAAMGIEHRVRPDGSLVVLAAHVEQLLNPGSGPTISPSYEPDWAGLAEATS